MSIGNIGKVGGLQPSAVTGSSHSPRTPFQQLAQLLEGGKLSAAQSAVSALTNFLQPPGAAASTAATTTAPSAATSAAASSSTNSTLGTDLQSLSQALSSGNVASARSAFAKFATDARAAGAFGHHRHGGARPVTTDSDAATTVAGTSTASSTDPAASWLAAAATPANATDGGRYRTLNLRA